MPETHLWMFVASFIVAVWWLKHWLIDPVFERWIIPVAGLISAIHWIFNAYAATRVVDASGGVQIVYGSQALAVFCAFMAVVSFLGIILGLVLWTEEAGLEAAAAARDQSGEGLGGRFN